MTMAELRSSHTGLEEEVVAAAAAAAAGAAAGVSYLTFLVQKKEVMHTQFSKSQIKAVGIYMNFHVYLVEVKGYSAVTCLHLPQEHLQTVKKKWVHIQQDYYTEPQSGIM